MRTFSHYRCVLLVLFSLGLIALLRDSNGMEARFNSGYLVVQIAAPDPGVTVSNPAGAYCTQLGYQYEIATAPDHSQDGYCVLPDETRCEAWDFYAGVCGQSYSVCARQGLKTIPLQDGQDPYSARYSVCADSHNGKQVASARELARVDQNTGLVSLSLQPPADRSTLDWSGPQRMGTLPAAFDWRSINGVNWLTPVKNQAGCGSCWAFAAVAVAESYQNIQTNNPNLDLDLSEQNLVNCVYGSNCSGGSSDNALTTIQTDGIVDESCNPYTGMNGTCGSGRCADWQSRLTHIGPVIENWFPASRDAIKQQVYAYGPAVVYMGIQYEYGGYFDANTVYRCTKDDHAASPTYGINHAVTLVGWDDAGQYWIIKNSWGSGWGSGGYFKLGYGECNVEYYTVMNIQPGAVDAVYSVQGTAGLNDWYRSNLTVNLQAQDYQGSPAANADIHYRLDNGAWFTAGGGSAGVPVNGDGTHTLQYYAQIPGKTSGPARILNLKIDTLAPSASWSTPAATVTVFQGQLSMSLNAAEPSNGSGVDKVEFWVEVAGVPTLLYTDTSAPYSYTWQPGISLPKESWASMYAIVWDRAGNKAEFAGGSIDAYYGGVSLFLPLVRP
jgi:C1A family cysteine protease